MKTTFFNSAIGTYVKHLITLFIMFFVEHGFSTDFSITETVLVIVVPTLPMLIKIISGVEGGFWNKWYGSLLKSVLVGAISFISAKGTFIGWTFNEMIKAIVPTILPLLFNILNPNDTRYGLKK